VNGGRGKGCDIDEARSGCCPGDSRSSKCHFPIRQRVRFC
jgi:hypothetical protein